MGQACLKCCWEKEVTHLSVADRWTSTSKQAHNITSSLSPDKRIEMPIIMNDKFLSNKKAAILLFYLQKVPIYRVSHGKRMFLRKTKLCEYFNKNLFMYNKNIH